MWNCLLFGNLGLHRMCGLQFGNLGLLWLNPIHNIGLHRLNGLE